MKYRTGYKYQLAEDEIFRTEIYPKEDIKTQFIELTKEGLLTIKSGYSWDGPSGPTIDRKSNMRGSLAHDALYQLTRQKWLPMAWRSKSDDLICELWIEDGMWPWLAKTEKLVLEKFAGPAADPKNAKKIYEAPAEKYLKREVIIND